MELHKYQLKAIDFIHKEGNVILSIGLGLGKTIICLKYIESIAPENVIIVAPKAVALSVWKQEAGKWGLPIHEKMIIVAGNPKQRLRAIQDTTKPYKIIGVDNLKDMEGNVTDLLIIDELTCFKNSKSKRFGYVKSINADRRIGLTGTFLANGAIDIWGQCSAVGLMHGVNSYFEAWRARYFFNCMQGSGQKFEKWELKKGIQLDDILSPIRSKILTLETSDWLELPPITFVKKVLQLSPREENEYMRLSMMLSVKLDNVVYSVKEQAKFMKLQTLANGFIYDEDSNAIRGTECTKIKEVAEFCRRVVAEGEQLLLFFAFREEAIMLSELFKKVGIRFCSPKNKDYLKLWKNREIDILLSHPASIGYGVNLQHESRIIVWSSITWNMNLFLQGNGRIARQGQTKPVYIYTFLASDTIEEKQYKALISKISVQNDFILKTKVTE